MGCSFLKRSCYIDQNAPAPNPDPSRWELLNYYIFPNSYVLKVRYYDATNFDGVKIMVYKGKYRKRLFLDPHFEDNPEAPIARFRPDEEGLALALDLARNL